MDIEMLLQNWVRIGCEFSFTSSVYPPGKIVVNCIAMAKEVKLKASRSFDLQGAQ